MTLSNRTVMNSVATSVLAAIMAAYILICTSCGLPRANNSAGAGADPLPTKSAQAIQALEYAKTVADFALGLGCAAGTFDQDVCETYALSSQAADITLKTAKDALEAYNTSKTLLTTAQLRDAFDQVQPLVAELIALRQGK